MSLKERNSSSIFRLAVRAVQRRLNIVRVRYTACILQCIIKPQRDRFEMRRIFMIGFSREGDSRSSSFFLEKPTILLTVQLYRECDWTKLSRQSASCDTLAKNYSVLLRDLYSLHTYTLDVLHKVPSHYTSS